MLDEYKIARSTKRKETRDRRKNLTCKVYSCKLQMNKLSNKKHEQLHRLFLEAKWFFNAVVCSGQSPNEYDAKNKTVNVYNPITEQKEERMFELLSSQMKQDIRDQINNSIKGLSTKKNRGAKVGKIKPTREVNSIPLRALGQTFDIDKEQRTLRIQRLKEPFKINGLDQIPEDAEIANARLVRKPSGYYLQITCFQQKQEKPTTGQQVGLDLGIGTTVVDSNGKRNNFVFPITRAIIRAQRNVSNKKKGSNNRKKAIAKLNKLCENQTNKKKDATNKFVAEIIRNNDVVAIQDENIKAWHASNMRGHSRRVQQSILGGIKAGFKKHPETVRVVERWFPSTQICPECKKKTKHGLEQRSYECGHCGHTNESRDQHAAMNILLCAIGFYDDINKSAYVGAERIDLKPVEISTSVYVCKNMCKSNR